MIFFHTFKVLMCLLIVPIIFSFMLKNHHNHILEFFCLKLTFSSGSTKKKTNLESGLIGAKTTGAYAQQSLSLSSDCCNANLASHRLLSNKRERERS